MATGFGPGIRRDSQYPTVPCWSINAINESKRFINAKNKQIDQYAKQTNTHVTVLTKMHIFINILLNF